MVARPPFELNKKNFLTKNDFIEVLYIIRKIKLFEETFVVLVSLWSDRLLIQGYPCGYLFFDLAVFYYLLRHLY